MRWFLFFFFLVSVGYVHVTSRHLMAILREIMNRYGYFLIAFVEILCWCSALPRSDACVVCNAGMPHVGAIDARMGLSIAPVCGVVKFEDGG